jgi:hypothetical protein
MKCKSFFCKECGFLFNAARARETQPDYVLFLPWNLDKEIIKQHEYIKNWGGKFIVMILKPKIVTPV